VILRPDITSEFNGEVGYIEINLDALQKKAKYTRPHYQKISRYPAVKRDLSLVAPKNINFDKIVTVLNQLLGTDKTLKEFDVFSIYEDDKIGKDNISYSLHLTFRNSERTLTDEEVNNTVTDILKLLQQNYGITLRS
jgi:phenylalanyl-tRNA synthetase beta chain